jgi:MoaA/NifB/PqqE/SkfB family radical SAM enzyme
VLRTAQGYLRRNDPDYLIFYVTGRCNLSCSFCFNRAFFAGEPQAGPELKLEEIRRIARGFRPLGHVILSGGEPFLRRDLPEIAASFHREAAAHQITIPTNGALGAEMAPLVERILRDCPGLGLHINLSVDGVGDQHDRLREQPGLYRRLLEARRALEPLEARHPNLAVNVITVITAENEASLPEILTAVARDFHPGFHDVGIDRQDLWIAERIPDCLRRLDHIETALLQPRAGSGLSALHRAVYRRLNKVIRSVAREWFMTFPCLAGRKLMVVGPTGALYPCETLWFQGHRFPAIPDFRLADLRSIDYDWRRARDLPEFQDILSFIRERGCFCAWECAIFNSLQYSLRYWPGLLAAWLRELSPLRHRNPDPTPPSSP